MEMIKIPVKGSMGASMRTDLEADGGGVLVLRAGGPEPVGEGPCGGGGQEVAHGQRLLQQVVVILGV